MRAAAGLRTEEPEELPPLRKEDPVPCRVKVAEHNDSGPRRRRRDLVTASPLSTRRRRRLPPCRRHPPLP